jgi:hypothetical protein
MTEHLWGMTLIPKVVDDNPANIERYVTVSNYRLRPTFLAWQRGLPHRCQQSARLPVPYHPCRGGLGHCALRLSAGGQ